MNDVPQPDIRERLADRVAIERALKQAVQEALELHRLRGVPIAVWRDRQVVMIPPEEIPRPDGEHKRSPAA
jgi:hypothetical protein